MLVDATPPWPGLPRACPGGAATCLETSTFSAVYVTSKTTFSATWAPVTSPGTSELLEFEDRESGIEELAFGLGTSFAAPNVLPFDALGSTTATRHTAAAAANAVKNKRSATIRGSM